MIRALKAHSIPLLTSDRKLITCPTFAVQQVPIMKSHLFICHSKSSLENRFSRFSEKVKRMDTLFRQKINLSFMEKPMALYRNHSEFFKKEASL